MKALLVLILLASAATAATTPQGPTVQLSRDRAEIVLNGVWRFRNLVGARPGGVGGDARPGKLDW